MSQELSKTLMRLESMITVLFFQKNRKLCSFADGSVLIFMLVTLLVITVQLFSDSEHFAEEKEEEQLVEAEDRRGAARLLQGNLKDLVIGGQ